MSWRSSRHSSFIIPHSSFPLHPFSAGQLAADRLPHLLREPPLAIGNRVGGTIGATAGDGRALQPHIPRHLLNGAVGADRLEPGIAANLPGRRAVLALGRIQVVAGLLVARLLIAFYGGLAVVVAAVTRNAGELDVVPADVAGLRIGVRILIAAELVAANRPGLLVAAAPRSCAV